jgi:hypothetical protein
MEPPINPGRFTSALCSVRMVSMILPKASAARISGIDDEEVEDAHVDPRYFRSIRGMG